MTARRLSFPPATYLLLGSLLASTWTAGCDTGDDGRDALEPPAEAPAFGKGDDTEETPAAQDNSQPGQQCTQQELDAKWQSVWQGYVAYEQAGCIKTSDGAGCAEKLAIFDAAAEGYFVCSSSLAFQAQCESLERRADDWRVWTTQNCENPTEQNAYTCGYLQFMIGYTEREYADLECRPRPASGECSGDSRNARVQQEGQLVKDMLAAECLGGDWTGDPCAAHRTSFESIKDANATCNATQYNESICDYYERKKAKAGSLIAAFCNPPAQEPVSVFPTYDGYCDYNRLHVQHYEGRIARDCSAD